MCEEISILLDMYMVGSFEGVCCYAFILYEMVESLKLCVVILLYYMNNWSYKP